MVALRLLDSLLVRHAKVNSNGTTNKVQQTTALTPGLLLLPLVLQFSNVPLNGSILLSVLPHLS